jgi:hypothetical protein
MAQLWSQGYERNRGARYHGLNLILMEHTFDIAQKAFCLRSACLGSIARRTRTSSAVSERRRLVRAGKGRGKV